MLKLYRNLQWFRRIFLSIFHIHIFYRMLQWGIFILYFIMNSFFFPQLLKIGRFWFIGSIFLDVNRIPNVNDVNKLGLKLLSEWNIYELISVPGMFSNYWFSFFLLEIIVIKNVNVGKWFLYSVWIHIIVNI